MTRDFHQCNLSMQFINAINSQGLEPELPELRQLNDRITQSLSITE